jgi:DNA end-binding protein Ku
MLERPVSRGSFGVLMSASGRARGTLRGDRRARDWVQPMPRAIWTGTLSFGLVSIPVRLFNATAPKDVRFHQFQSGTGQRVRIRRVVPDVEPPEGVLPQRAPGPGDEGSASLSSEAASFGLPPPSPRGEQEVPYEEVVKGYEVDAGRYVMIDPEELAALAPEQTRTIEIEDFVDLAQIDPVYFEKSYFVVPQRGGEKPYALLLRAMEDAGKVAIGRFVLRSREHLAAVRPTRGVLGLETLFYADEVRAAEEVGAPVGDAQVSERELKLAGQLIASLATEWLPDRYLDSYRERVLQLIESKARGEELVVEPTSVAPVVSDLMSALRASVEAARERRAATDGAPRAKSRRSASP